MLRLRPPAFGSVRNASRRSPSRSLFDGNRLRAFLLTVPLALFLVFAFVLPIAEMLFRSVDNSIVTSVLPRTAAAIEAWDSDGTALPDEAVFEAMTLDMQKARDDRTLGRVGRRLNYQQPGMASLFRKTGRQIRHVAGPHFRNQLIHIDPRWGDAGMWRLIRREARALTDSYFLASFDLTRNAKGEIAWQPTSRSIYLALFLRTLWMSLAITLICLFLGYPVAYLIAASPTRYGNLLLILVLLPFWTSLLVRTTAWVALLQSQGVLNDLLVAAGLVSEQGRLQMIHNRFGTFVAMTHVLLPFMILPIYAVMKTIPPTYMRAARSLGAPPSTAFLRVYLPNTVPGIGAGCLLVFVLSIGYYITPALVGGRTGTFISNFIAHHIDSSLNWGLAAALGVVLLIPAIALYWLYERLVGIDKLKLN